MTRRRQQAQPGFADLVVSDPAVRNSFRAYRPVRLWWLLLLALHGNSRRHGVPRNAGAEKIGEGFKLYAVLYRCVAAGLLAFAAVCWRVWPGAFSEPAVAAAVLGGLYLWIMSGLGLQGAASYRRGARFANVELALFVVMVVVFVAVLSAVTSIRMHESGVVPLWVNLPSCLVLAAIGGGSYCLELVYLCAGQTSCPAAEPAE